MRRFRVNRRKSKRLFRKTASRYHKKNVPRLVRRGGIRL